MSIAESILNIFCAEDFARILFDKTISSKIYSIESYRLQDGGLSRQTVFFIDDSAIISETVNGKTDFRVLI